MPFYLNTVHSGIATVSSAGDGYKIGLTWNRAYPRVKTNRIAYNIYFSIEQETVFSEGPKFVSIGKELSANIIDLPPGQLYHFAVRAVELDPNFPSSYSGRGYVWYRKKDYDKAIEDYLEAVKRSNNDYTAPLYSKKAALAYEMKGDYTNALALYQNIKTQYYASTEASDIDKYIARAQAKGGK